MTENEFLLQDRIAKIQSVISKYGEENFYLSFSGGKDSTVLSALLDMACPGNKIPRVYANTGIEYRLILEFVEREKAKDHPWELVILTPKTPIKPTLEKEGYPFKSKLHARYVNDYQSGRGGNKACEKYYTRNNIYSDHNCPKILLYQFDKNWEGLKISDKCCDRLKKDPLKKYEKETGRKYAIIGIMPSEGGRRIKAKCLIFKQDKFKSFQPLVMVNKEWENWFIKKYGIEICEIYKEPYNFDRTGCKGCPFALHLQEELDTLEKFFPTERKQCEIIWKPVYDEYRRIGYRLKDGNKVKKPHQMTVDKWFTENGGD